MTEDEQKGVADRLSGATRSGDLAAAYRVIQPLSLNDARGVALWAGFEVIYSKKAAEFYADLQRQIAAAVRAKTDGFGLRAVA